MAATVELSKASRSWFSTAFSFRNYVYINIHNPNIDIHNPKQKHTQNSNVFANHMENLNLTNTNS